MCPIDADSSVRLRVVGRSRPGGTAYNHHLDAEFVITSAFAHGRLGLRLSPEAMDDWATALDVLSGGQDIRWSVMGETEIGIAIDRQFSTPRPIVTVDDSAESGVSVRICLDPEMAEQDRHDAAVEKLLVTATLSEVSLCTQVTGDRCPGGRLGVRLGRLARA
ncbi:DUF5959 family protein [Streptomyces antibioticus]|uniref:DUF5959 family protein n=1 Tax=Streptomyces antibioticus TaxID=1890 RepID=UPI0021188ECD|nr:DUF5959 family protein [Streptomyces antibioticus]MCX4741037.1 DUF5959 family protein [Streptomyces antibioticus]